MLQRSPDEDARPGYLRGIENARRSPFLRILLIGFLAMLLQIPIAMIQELIWDRQSTGKAAIDEVTSKWGYQQSLLGPRILVPFTDYVTQMSQDGKPYTVAMTNHAHFLPTNLEVVGRIQTQIRYRGIFHVPVYRASVVVRGRFLRPTFDDWGIDPTNIHWDRALLWIQLGDARAIQEPTSLRWNGHELPFLAGTGTSGTGTGIHVPMKGELAEDGYDFEFPLELNGSMGFFAAPFGDQSTIRLESDWQNPSFAGNWLPTDRQINAKGFEASWKIPSLGRNYPQRWIRDDRGIEQSMAASTVGVDFLSPINPYRMADRSVKYQSLFLILTFVTLWLFELLLKVRVHPVQYLLVGAAMCLFYLLELSLAEHFGFVTAYLIAAGAVVTQIGGYAITVLRGFRRASILGGVVAMLYAYLYVLLMNQDYSLLFGSVGLFIVLAMVMALTRRIDWYEGTRATGS